MLTTRNEYGSKKPHPHAKEPQKEDKEVVKIEVALKAIPHIGDEKKRIPEEKALLDLWLAMDEIKAKFSDKQIELPLNQGGQMSLF